jgi:magnesium-transporting ATPase (P-type)
MLTGDKLETAENIGHSCNLIQNGMIVWKISTKEEV